MTRPARSTSARRAQLLGAWQEHGLRPGTENNADFVGLGVACDLARTHLASDVRQLACVRNILWQVLNATIPSVVRHTPPVSLPNSPTVSFPRVTGRAVLAHARGLAVATGYTFHSGLDTPSVTLLAMGVAPGKAVGAVQLSLGRATTATDVSNRRNEPDHRPLTADPRPPPGMVC